MFYLCRRFESAGGIGPPGKELPYVMSHLWALSTSGWFKAQASATVAHGANEPTTNPDRINKLNTRRNYRLSGPSTNADISPTCTDEAILQGKATAFRRP